MSLARFSVRRPVTVAMVCLAGLLVGGVALTRLPIELYPNFSYGDISIIINIRGGMPPEEVESRVTKPIEETISDVDRLKDVISISEEGRARVVLRFEPGTDMDLASAEVRETFSKIRDKLPSEIEKPVIARFEQNDLPVLITAVTAPGYTPEMLRRIVDEQIKDRILRVEGVANVDVGGGRERKILVEVDLEKLQAFRLPIDRVTRLLNVSNLNLLGGDVREKRRKVLIRAMGEFQSLDEIRELGIAVTPGRSIIRLKDVAEVKDSFLEATSYARVNTLPVVSLYIQKESTANTVRVADRVLGTIERIQEDPRLPRELTFITTFNQADRIRRAIDTVGSTLLSGAVLVILVLGAFLATHWFPRAVFPPLAVVVTILSVISFRTGQIPVPVMTGIMIALLIGLLATTALFRGLRPTLIVAVSIPVATVITFALLFSMRGILPTVTTLNVMTLGGLALGVGLLVDNGIVVLDNVIKHRARGSPPRLAAAEGTSEMILAILASTLTSAVVYLPVIFISPDIRILYSGVAITIVFSLLASLAVAVTVVPMMLSRMRFPVRAASLARGFWRRRFGRILGLALRLRWAVVAAVLCLGGAGLWAFSRIPQEFLGTTEQEDFTVFVELPSGAKLEISDKAVEEIEKILADVPEVKTVSARIEPWSSKVYVKLVPLTERSRSTKEVIESIRPLSDEVERNYPESFIYFEEPQESAQREVIIEVYGWDYDVLNSLSIEMLKRMKTIPGLTDLKLRWRRGRPEWLVRVDKVRAAAYGLTVEEIANSLHAQMRGLRATLYHTEGKEVEVVTRLEEADRATLEKLRKIAFILPDRRVVQLEQVATLEPALGPSKIWRKDKQRMIQVSANRGRYSLGEAFARTHQAIADLPIPQDYYWRFGENYSKTLETGAQLRVAGLISLALVLLVMGALFESFSQPFVVLMTALPSTLGAAVLLAGSGQSMNVGAWMGVIFLAGIVVNNGIILVDETNRLLGQGRGLFRSVVAGSLSRLRPIAMTSMTTILGLLPMALSRTEESSLWAPMALIAIGGMTVNALVTPLVGPAIYMANQDVIRFFRLIFVRKPAISSREETVS